MSQRSALPERLWDAGHRACGAQSRKIACFELQHVPLIAATMTKSKDRSPPPQAKDSQQIAHSSRPRSGEREPERTAAGEQHVLPGAERISDAKLAKRRAKQPLKPKAEQKPADEGLFSDENKQASLFK
jgi:hypothetical protein